MLSSDIYLHFEISKCEIKGIRDLMDKYYCTNCKNSTTEGVRRGRTWIEILAWCCYIIPGIVYTAWRRSGDALVCPVCAQEKLVKNIVKQDPTVDCEWCGEEIKAKAKVCKHCSNKVKPTEVENDELLLEKKTEKEVIEDRNPWKDSTPEKKEIKPEIESLELPKVQLDNGLLDFFNFLKESKMVKLVALVAIFLLVVEIIETNSPRAHQEVTTDKSYTPITKLSNKHISKIKALLPSGYLEGVGYKYLKDNLEVFIELTNGYAGHIRVSFLDSSGCSQSNRRKPASYYLGKLGISTSNLDHSRERSHASTFQDHKNKIKIIIGCFYEGGPITASFSKEYYMK